MTCIHGNDPFVCMENGCISPDRNMQFVIKQNAPNFWYFVLLDASGGAVYVSPVRYASAEECAAVVDAVRSTNRRTPVKIVREPLFSPSFRTGKGAV